MLSTNEKINDLYGDSRHGVDKSFYREITLYYGYSSSSTSGVIRLPMSIMDDVGYYLGGDILSRTPTYIGWYWTSRVDGSSNIFAMFARANGFTVQTRNVNKFYGGSIRCGGKDLEDFMRRVEA